LVLAQHEHYRNILTCKSQLINVVYYRVTYK
jgi:hypothetical protein